MICVTIGRGRHSSLIEEWKAAAAAGVDLVELRIDCLRRDPELKRIFKERPTKAVFTIRRGADGGLWRGNEEKRQQLIREAIALGIEYVDLEQDVAPKIRRFGKTQRIVSYHNLKTTPADLNDILKESEQHDPDIVKIAASAANLSDASRILQLAQASKFPVIPIAMGELGVFTRVLGAKFGAPFTYAGFNPERIFAAGMLRYPVLRKDYRYNQIDAQTEVYGVIGDPIEQSLSPAIHNAAFRHLGLNKVLVPFLVPNGQVETFLKQLKWLNIKGCSVTIPHKEAVIPFLKTKEEAVEHTGACNTLIFNEDGTLSGYNTDYQAAIDTLEQGMAGGEIPADSPSPLVDKQVLILGAGGAARSLAFGASHRGGKVSITNRSDEKAETLAEQVGCRKVAWSQRATVIADVIVNCTPVGMHPQVDDTPLPPAAFGRSGIVVFDTVYHPEHTMLLKLARERQAIGISGVEMFLRQAALQFKLYTGQEAPLDVMRETLKRKLGPLRDD